MKQKQKKEAPIVFMPKDEEARKNYVVLFYKWRA